MKRLALALCMGGILSGLLFKGSFLQIVFGMAVGVYLGLPILFALILWLSLGYCATGRVPPGLRTTFLVFVIFVGAVLLSLGSGMAIHYSEIHATRAYVAQVAPILDAYQKKQGTYPSSLGLLEIPDPPRLLSQPNSYWADQNSFRFEYWDSAGLMDGYFFDSKTRTWQYFD